MRSGHIKVGDHIFVHRGLYTHHGIYCGGGRVLHYDSTLLTMSQAVVRETTLEQFAGGGEVLVRIYEAGDPPAVVIRRARSRLGERRYDLLTNNCEHFADWCKTGKGTSLQVDTVAEAAVPCLSALGLRMAALPVLAVAAPAALGLSLVGAAVLTLAAATQAAAATSPES